MRVAGRVYLFEFKVAERSGEGAALAQLQERGYADKHRAGGTANQPRMAPDSHRLPKSSILCPGPRAPCRGTMRLLCVGDIHLGRQPSRLPAEILDELRPTDLGPAAAWRLSVDFALEAGVDAVLLAGDVVEQENDFYEAYGDLRRGVDRLTKAGIAVLGVSGNHDVLVLPRLADAVPGFRLIGRGGRWEIEGVTGRDGRNVQVLGWSFPERRVSASPFESHELPELDPQAGPIVGLLHCDRDAAGSHYAPVRSDELAGVREVDAWLLGHIHKPDPLTPPRPIGYLGSLTGLDPGEPGKRGPWLLESTGPELTIEHLPLAPLRWEEVEVGLDGLEAAEEVHRLVTAALDALHERISGERKRPRAVGCRLRFTGRSSVHRKAIERVLAESDPLRLLYPREDIAYFVHDWRMEVLPALDLEELARGADPPALIARKILLLRSPDGPERRELVVGARRRLESRTGNRRFTDRGFVLPSDEQIATSLERAAIGALGELLAQREGSA